MGEDWDVFVKNLIKIFKKKFVYSKTTNKDTSPLPPPELYLSIYLQTNHTLETLSLELFYFIKICDPCKNLFVLGKSI